MQTLLPMERVPVRLGDPESDDAAELGVGARALQCISGHDGFKDPNLRCGNITCAITTCSQSAIPGLLDGAQLGAGRNPTSRLRQRAAGPRARGTIDERS